LIGVKRLWAAWLLAGMPLLAQPEPAPSAKVQLSDRLSRWKQEIEAVRGSKVVLARIYTEASRNEIILPADVEERPLLRQYFLNPAFIAEFTHMHAANLTHKQDGRLVHFVLLNMARAAEWGGREEAVIAHEFGHIWLFVNNYPAPAFEGRIDSCVAIQAGDAVQHVLIRHEMRRRGIDFHPYWIRNLQAQLEALERAGPQAFRSLAVCRQMALLTQWVDARLGLSAESWEEFDRYQEAMARSFSHLEEPAEQIAGMLRNVDLSDVEAYTAALRAVLLKMWALATDLSRSAN
jgi:hypothetical protein